MIEQDNEGIISAVVSSDNYDSPWKAAVEHYFPEFMAFYLALLTLA